MFKYILISFASLILMPNSQCDNMGGNGIWSLINIATCNDELDIVVLEIAIQRHRLNRTTDGLSATFSTERTIHGAFVGYIEICKYVDGGCKQYQIISDTVEKLIKTYAESLVKRGLELAKVNPPELPLADGSYEIEDLMLDYCEFPTTAVYGRFQAKVYLIDNNARVSCLQVVVEFNKPDDDDEICL